MNITEKLDLAIKLRDTGTTDGSYTIGTIKRNTYMSNEEWDAFLLDMNPSARCEFECGGGSELKEKNGRPPKMASFGSSSRMIYNLSRQSKGFVFEKQLPTTVGGKANLDGFLETEDGYIFIEAKCHEPYSAKKSAVSISYRKLYEYINARMGGDFNIEMIPSKCGRYMNVSFSTNNDKFERFDVKQMICHLLGIATGILNGTFEKKKISFIYLLFDPTKLPLESDVKPIIDNIYERTVFECGRIEWSKLFSIILEFLNNGKFKGSITNEEINKMISGFRFTLVSQDTYSNLIK
jgi:hypothetical protein